MNQKPITQTQARLLKLENEKLKKDNKKLKILILQLQAALKRDAGKMAVLKAANAFNEAETTRLKLKNNILIGIGDQ